MHLSLRNRLLLTMTIVPVAAVAAVAVIASRTTRSEFDNIVTAGSPGEFTLAQRWEGTVLGAGEMVSVPAPKVVDTAWIATTPERIALEALPATPLEAGVRVVRVYQSTATTQAMDEARLRLLSAPVPASGSITGLDGNNYVVFGAAPFMTVSAHDRQSFLGSVDLTIAGAVAGTVLVLGVAALLTSRRMVRPLESLTLAARRFGQGDFSQRVTARGNDEIGQLARSFNGMAESIERGEELRRHMTSDIAHELRTPLNNVAGYLDAVAEGVVQPKPEVIASLQEEVSSLVRLVNDLEQLSLAEAGALRMEHQEVDVKALVQRAVRVVEQSGAARGVTLAIEAPDTPVAVEGDGERLGQVVRNLLDNAITHTHEGGHVVARVQADAAGVRIEVADTGEGIPDTHLPLIFERFYRVDPSRSRSTGGAGLGLAIVRQLVDAHRGSVAVASELGKGTTFTVTLPATT